MRQYWAGSQPPNHVASGASYNTSVTLSNVSRLPDKQLAAYQLEEGVEVELAAWGNFSTTGTPTLLLGFYFGGVIGVALGATAATTTASGAASFPWLMRYHGRVRATGTSGSIVGQGVLHLGTSLTAFSDIALPTTAAARTVTINTTIVQTITVGAQWGTSSASNALVCDDLSVRFWS